MLFPTEWSLQHHNGSIFSSKCQMFLTCSLPHWNTVLQILFLAPFLVFWVFLSSLCTAWVFNYSQGAGVTAVGVVPRLSRPILARKLLPLQPHASSQRVRIPFLLLKEMLNLGGLMWEKGSKGWDGERVNRVKPE